MRGCPCRPVICKRFCAQFSERWISKDEALGQYQAATRAAPKSAGAWTALVGFQIRLQQYAQAQKTASDGLKVLPDNPLLRSLREDASVLEKLGPGLDLQALREGICVDPQDAGITQVLAELTAAKAAHLPPADTARRVAAVANQHPANLPVQLQAVRILAQAGLNDAAVEIARRAANANPNSAEPHRLLAGIYVNLGEWTKAEQSALLWRRRAPDQSLIADIALAEIYLLQPKKDAAAAIVILKPYIRPAGLPENARILELYSRALVLQNRASEAAVLLTPLLADSALASGLAGICRLAQRRCVGIGMDRKGSAIHSERFRCRAMFPGGGVVRNWISV